MNRYVLFIAILCLVVCVGSADALVLDLTTAGSSGNINGVIFGQYSPRACLKVWVIISIFIPGSARIHLLTTDSRNWLTESAILWFQSQRRYFFFVPER